MGALLNEITSGITSTLRDFKTYLFGRGIVMTVAIAAGTISSGILGAAATSALAPALGVALVGGVILSGVMRLREMRYNQDRMADIYRDDIASQFGIAPEQVTRQHVHTLAFGDARLGIPPNPILREEIDREWNKTWLKVATSSLAAMAGYGLVQFGLAHEWVQSTLLGTLGPALGTTIGVASTAIVTGFTGLLLNNGLDFSIQRMTTLGNLTMHDRIVKIHRDIGRGRTVTKEQVFALFAAADQGLTDTIVRRHGNIYDMLPQPVKAQIIESLGAAGHMQAVADNLNNRVISAGAVAFIVSGQRGIEPARRPNAAPVQQAPITVAPAPMQEPRFSERVGGQRGDGQRGDEGLSHTEREELRRATAALHGAVR